MTTFPSESRLIPLAEQPLAQWRGGTTRAIVAFPPEHLGNLAAADLWVGTATIERDGPYSHFADRTRIHLPMRGNGLRLHFHEPEETLALPNLAQATFAGDRPLDVRLIDGAVEAFNVIMRPGSAVTVRVVQAEHTESLVLPSPSRMVHVLYAVEGEWRIRLSDQETVELTPSAAFVCETAGEMQLICSNRACVLIHAMVPVDHERSNR